MSDFSSATVSFGLVVSDIRKSVAFYRDAIGMIEAGGFDVPPSMGGDAGLCDYKPFHVHIMQLADTDDATEIKLMQFPDSPGARINNDFIHSSYGVRYLTIHVESIAAAVDRAKKHGAPVLGKGVVALPPSFPAGLCIACVRDPDGNIIEFVGPK